MFVLCSMCNNSELAQYNMQAWTGLDWTGHCCILISCSIMKLHFYRIYDILSIIMHYCVYAQFQQCEKLFCEVNDIYMTFLLTSVIDDLYHVRII